MTGPDAIAPRALRTGLIVGVIGALLTASPLAAVASELTMGVFLPDATFATNSARSAWTQRLAERLSAATEGRHTFKARTFARRRDVMSFLSAGRIDLLVTDGLLQLDRDGEVIAHSLGDPAAALFARAGGDVLALRGETVALAAAGARDLSFFEQSALEGECSAERFFGSVRTTKDAAAALGAVRTSAAAAAFAPADHPAAVGLERLTQGGALPRALVVLVDPSSLSPLDRRALVEALVEGAGRGGGIDGWSPGAGPSFERARALSRRPPKALTTPLLLAPRASGGLRPPPLRLQARGALPPPAVTPQLTVRPDLPEPPL